MKISIKQYLLYSSVFAIFTEAFLVNFIIDWKLLYLIIVSNYILLVRIKKIKLNIYFLIVVALLFIQGLIAYSVISIPINFLLSQIIGITILSTYYYNLIPLYSREEIIEVYLKMSLWVAILAYPMFFLDINLDSPDRLQGIFTEPAHYAIVVIPACYYNLKSKKYIPFAIIFITLLLSSSSIGYLGIGLMLVLPNITLKRVKYLFIVLPFTIIAFLYVYNNFEFFRLRVDDTYRSLNAVNTGKFEEYTNLSSYALLSNAFVVKKNLTDHPFGSGLGSHYYMHKENYIKYIRIPEYIRTTNNTEINSKDACSLFLRICSDTGILGFIFILFILYHISKSFRYRDSFFAQSIVIYLILKLFRDGHYFPPEMYFFVWLLYFDLREQNNLKQVP